VAPLLIVRDESHRLSLGELLSSIARLRFTGWLHATRFGAGSGGWLGVRSERILHRLQGSLFQINISEVVAHEADEPNPVFDFADADGLSGEGFGKIDFLFCEGRCAATGDDDRAVMKRGNGGSASPWVGTG